MHINDVTWKSIRDEFVPGLSYWDKDKEMSHFPLIPETVINWTVEGPRRCIGRRDEFKEFTPCPFNSMVVKGKKCYECGNMDGFDPCIRCTGSACNASPFRHKECQSSQYVLYLAYFSDGSLKVGVSSSHRVRTRWVEQGADYACVIAEVTGGDNARRLEQKLGKNRGVRLAIPGSTKASTIRNSTSLEDAEGIFREFLDESDCPECRDEIQIEDMMPHYNLQDLAAEPLSWPDRSLPLVGQQIHGKVLGMKGALLVTYIGHAYRIISLKKLVGYTLENSIKKPVISQTGLFDFI
ncbi:MAG: DUF2797 domain-containing protein [Candidatus Thorarchaeota archaeon]